MERGIGSRRGDCRSCPSPKSTLVGCRQCQRGQTQLIVRDIPYYLGKVYGKSLVRTGTLPDWARPAAEPHMQHQILSWIIN